MGLKSRTVVSPQSKLVWRNLGIPILLVSEGNSTSSLPILKSFLQISRSLMTDLHSIYLSQLTSLFALHVSVKATYLNIAAKIKTNRITQTRPQSCLPIFSAARKRRKPRNCVLTDDDGSRLLNAAEKFQLILHNSDTFTHIDVARGTKSNIDLVFSTSDIASYMHTRVLEDSMGSDHFPISIIMDTEISIYHRKSFKVQSKKTS